MERGGEREKKQAREWKLPVQLKTTSKSSSFRVPRFLLISRCPRKLLECTVPGKRGRIR